MNIGIIGGGISGLAAAYYLSTEHQITLFEAQKQLGGRARCTAFGEHIIDHGFHALSTSDRYLMQTLESLNIKLPQAFSKIPCKFNIISEQTESDLFRLRDAARPFSLIAAIFGLSNLTRREKLRSTIFVYRCLFLRKKISPSVTLDALLIRYRQNGKMKKRIWEPLSLALLNTPSRHASAKLFIETIRNFFFNSDRKPHYLLPKLPLCKTLTESMMQSIEQNGGSVLLNHKVDRILFDSQGITGVRIEQQNYEFDHVIVATNPHQASHLLAQHATTQSVSRQLTQFRYEPVTTIYFCYAATTRLEQPVNLLVGMTSQWAYDISPSGDEGMIAVSISGNGPHMSMPDDALATHIHRELKRNVPGLPEPVENKIIREKTTHLVGASDIELLRPNHFSGVKGLWISGYYCKTELPANINSAIKSGLLVANLIQKQ